MFRKKRTVINGVELPEDFNVSSVINNIAISNDGKYAAVTRDGNVVMGDVPDDGRIEVDGTVINYQKGRSRVNVGGYGSNVNISGSGISMSSISGGSVVMSGGSITIGGKSLDYEIDKTYAVKSGDEIGLVSKNEDIALGLRDDNQARVEGLTGSEPQYAHGRLFVDDLQGKLWLPRGVSDLELALETKNGSVTGDIIHPGVVESKNGSIVLNLYAPLKVDASTKNGSVNVTGMESQGHGRYVPIGESAVGKLRASTKNGSVMVNYLRR
tara:strand:- start:193 stop:999 length:807 start_codon:yes stop_codon:yes gene_type:complete